MNRRSFLSFIGLGAIGAALSIEPSPPMEPAYDAVLRDKDIQRVPSYLDPETTITDPGYTHGLTGVNLEGYETLKVRWSGPGPEIEDWPKP